MRHQYNKIQTVAILNKVMMAYFLNIISNEINIYDHQPTMPELKILFAKVIDNNHQYMKNAYHGRVLIENFDVEFLAHSSIDDFMTDKITKPIKACAKEFLHLVKQHQYFDLIFLHLPDAPPFISVCDHDPDTNFFARTVVGRNIGEPDSKGIFEFYCLIADRMRETEEFSPYEKCYMNVEQMTDEERSKYDKKIEMPND